MSARRRAIRDRVEREKQQRASYEQMKASFERMQAMCERKIAAGETNITVEELSACFSQPQDCNQT